MALIACPECNGKVSTTAVACPHCGYTQHSNKPKAQPTPNDFEDHFPEDLQEETEPAKKKDNGPHILLYFAAFFWLLAEIMVLNGEIREFRDMDGRHALFVLIGPFCGIYAVGETIRRFFKYGKWYH